MKMINKDDSLYIYIYTYNLIFDLISDHGNKGEEDKERSGLIYRLFFHAPVSK